METLCWLSASDLLDLYRRGSVDAPQVLGSVLRRVDGCEPSLNALYLRKDTEAAAQAADSAARWRNRSPRSALEGVPVTVKENLFSIGDPAPIGAAINPRTPKTVNSPVVDRLNEAGLVTVGKTTMPDFGMLSSGQSSFHGVTRNPWQLNRNPGGSSSGAGAACAAGYGPLHVGTDIGGSIRLPASFCGIYGLKPSLGRVPINPPYIGRVAGPMTRTVRDAAMLMDIIAKPDPAHRDFMNLPPHSIEFAGSLEQFDLRGKRIAVFADTVLGWPVQSDVAAAVWDCAQKLESQGARVETIAPFLTEEMLDSICGFFEARSGADINLLNGEQRKLILPFIVQWATHRSASFSGADVMRFYGGVMAMKEAVVAATHPFDFVLSPVCPIPAFEADFCCPGNDPAKALWHIAFTVGYNFSEQPAASINWSYSTEAASEGLPIGVQIAGRRFDDLGVLQMSRVIEQLRPQQRPWPVRLG
ncbi:MAG: amidase [Betaproteobacteria bacterium]|nr:MAG: amidase [Betaproteobacteria bacterium]